MKLLAVFSLFLAVATSYPIVKTWTFGELSEAIEKSSVDPEIIPYLEDALNLIILSLYTGENLDIIQNKIPSPSGALTWTVDELTEALTDPNSKPEYRESVRKAYEALVAKNKSGNIQQSAEVLIAALDISTWTKSDIKEALNYPDINPDVIPYLEIARAELDEAIKNGENRERIYVVTPVGLILPNGSFRCIPTDSNYSKLRCYYKNLKNLLVNNFFSGHNSAAKRFTN